MGTLRQDIRQTLRRIRSAPVFAVAVILTLAVGIGANTAIFSIVRTVLLDPLPYPQADQLVSASPYPWLPAAVVLDLQQSAGSMAAVAAYYPRQFAITSGGEPVQLEGAWVTSDFFSLLGAGLARGRNFEPADTRPGSAPTALIAYGLWQRRFGGSPAAVGSMIRIDGTPHRIIGVVERGFRQFAPRSDHPEVWVPFRITPTNPDGSISYVIPLVRLRRGVPGARAQSDLLAAVSRFREAWPQAEGPPGSEVHWATLRSDLVAHVRPALLLLQLAVGVVLLLACVNVANLLLVRFGARQGELALRAVLGASRGRLLRQLLTESVVLALLGGLAGLLLMSFSLKLILAVAPADVPRIAEVSADGTVLLFTLATSLLTGLLFGVLPAAVLLRQPLHGSLKEGARTTTGSRRRRAISRALVVGEVSLTLMLLVGAGLLLRSFLSLTAQAPGFRTAGVLAVDLKVPETRLGEEPQLDAFYHQVLERLRQVPTVQSVAVANNLPISRGHAIRDYVVEGAASDRPMPAQYGVVSPDYFRTLDIPLRRGRAFADTDRRGALRVAVVDEAMAHAAWPQQDPIGKRFRFEDDPDAWLTVVGVVADTRGSGLASEPRPGFYIAYQQRPETPVELAMGHIVVLLVRSRASAASLATPLRQAIWAVDPQQPVPAVASLESIVTAGVSPQRFRATLLGVFAAIALLLVIAGIYGVIESIVAERTHEFGIRVALGAAPRDIVAIVLRWGVGLAAVGVGLGLLGISWLNHYLAGLLFGVTPTDTGTILVAVATVVLVTLAACTIPACRATRIDPLVALRSERRATPGTSGSPV